MKFKPLYATLLLSIFQTCFSAEINSKEFLCVPESPPYSGSQLPNGGPLTEVVVETLRLAKIKVELRHAPWARILHDAKNGECLVLGLWSTKQRRAIFHFSSLPIIKQELGLFTTNKSSFSDLGKGVLAVQRFSYVPPKLMQQAGNIYEVTSIKQGLEMLAKSRVDVLYAEMGHVNHLIGLDDVFKKTNRIFTQKVETKLGYLAISKNHPNATRILNSFDKNIKPVFKQIDNTDNQWVPLEFLSTH